MSFQALNWATRLVVGSTTAKFVLMALANYADDEGTCFPSIAMLQGDTELSKRAVSGAIKTLCDKGLLVTERQRNDDGSLGRNRYRLQLNCKEPLSVSAEIERQGRAEPGAGNAHGETDADQVHLTASPGAPHNSPGASGAPPIDEPPIEPPLEPSGERERADARAPDDGLGGSPEPNAPEPHDVGPDFGEFWRKWFNRGIDSKSKAKSAYDRLSVEEKRAAIAGIKPYKSMMDAAGRKKIPAAFTYLDEKKWEDLGSEPDANANGLPPEVKPYSPLWTATVIELLRTKAVPRNRFTFKHLCEGKSVNLMFARERNRELVSAAEAFKPTRADSPAGRAFLVWLERQLADQRLHHLMPLFREDFGLHLPPPAIAREWGLPLPGAQPTSHPPPDTEDDISAAFT